MKVLGQAARCAGRTVRLLLGRHLHVPNTAVRQARTLPDGRSFVVFRETTCDIPAAETPVVLAVWFRLRFIPPNSPVRRWFFERLCIVNTMLFAGFEGYLVKLWMVDPATSDYAGLYSWAGAGAADTYGRYITALLRPWCVAGSTGYEVSESPA